MFSDEYSFVEKKPGLCMEPSFFSSNVHESLYKAEETVGIDFGNSKICVSSFNGETFTVFQLESKTSFMPAWLTLKENEFFVGVAAKNTQKQKTTKLTLFDIRRCLTSGKQIYSNIPYCLSEELDFKKDGVMIPLVRVIAIFLYWIKDKIEAENQYVKIKNVVLTYPKEFNAKQRQILLNACHIAELRVTFLSEPMATAITYHITKPEVNGKICVIDFGGGKLDVAVIKIDNGKIELLDYKSELEFGGRDLDEIIVAECCREISRAHPAIDLTEKHVAVIREKCILAKESLTSVTTINIEIDIANEDISFPITREWFEVRCCEMFDYIGRTIQTIAVAHQDISDVVLVGGSTRIPRIQKDLEKIFPVNIINKTFNAEESIAKGAAVYAYILKQAHMNMQPSQNKNTCHKIEIFDREGDSTVDLVFDHNDEDTIKKETKEVTKMFRKEETFLDDTSSAVKLYAEPSREENNVQKILVKDAYNLVGKLEEFGVDNHNSYVLLTLKTELTSIKCSYSDKHEKLQRYILGLQLYHEIQKFYKEGQAKWKLNNYWIVKEIENLTLDKAVTMETGDIMAHFKYLNAIKNWYDIEETVDEFRKTKNSIYQLFQVKIDTEQQDLQSSFVNFLNTGNDVEYDLSQLTKFVDEMKETSAFQNK